PGDDPVCRAALRCPAHARGRATERPPDPAGPRDRAAPHLRGRLPASALAPSVPHGGPPYSSFVRPLRRHHVRCTLALPPVTSLAGGTSLATSPRRVRGRLAPGHPACRRAVAGDGPAGGDHGVPADAAAGQDRGTGAAPHAPPHVDGCAGEVQPPPLGIGRVAAGD